MSDDEMVFVAATVPLAAVPDGTARVRWSRRWQRLVDDGLVRVVSEPTVHVDAEPEPVTTFSVDKPVDWGTQIAGLTVDEVLAQVGDDPDVAAAAASAERETRQRSTLLDRLDDVVVAAADHSLYDVDVPSDYPGD